MPLALYALLRLQGQVGAAMVNANRNLAAYELMGVPVLPDASTDFPGPLGGLLAWPQHCTTPWLVTVPCSATPAPSSTPTHRKSCSGCRSQAGAEAHSKAALQSRSSKRKTRLP
jgi:molybdopterin-guanine dinucleotide biosynthesis protein A